MYSVVELKNLTVKPKINDISLELLRKFYECFLHPFIYTYRIIDAHGSREIAVQFHTRNFCHLLGVESIARNSVKYSDLHHYRGENGWNNIKNGYIDIRHLKSLNQRKFQSVKAKYVYFYLIPSILEMPLAVRYDKSNVASPTKIECELLFYSMVDHAVIHLGLEKDSEGDYYVPRTFFVEKLGKDQTKDIYIENQEQLMVIKQNRIILL